MKENQEVIHLAKVYLGISTVPTFIGSTFTEEIIQFAKVAYACRLYDTPTPPVAE